MISKIHESISSLNSNMFFAGIMMLTLNIGSRYVQLNLSPSAESYLKYAITKEFLIFTIAWMGTRNIYVALTLTAAFIILADYGLNDKYFVSLAQGVEFKDYCLIEQLLQVLILIFIHEIAHFAETERRQSTKSRR